MKLPLQEDEVFCLLKMIDVNTKSITEAKKDFSKIIKDAVETGEPTFIFNHNKPEAVILSNEVYEKLVKGYNELEEKAFYSHLNERANEGPQELIPSEDIVKSNQKYNPFSDFSDDELFD